MDDLEKPPRSLIEAALAARLELLSGGASGASTYRVHGLAEPCVLKVIDASGAGHVRARGVREIRFYDEIAARLPLHTPRVLASLVEASGYCALLLAAYAPVKPANETSDAEFSEIAEQLGRFHAVYWRRTDQLDAFSWLARPVSLDLSQDARHASETWRALARQPQFGEVLTAATLRDIDAALVKIRTRPEFGPAAATTLCNGDCHLDNLLRDRDGRLVWADWQEVRLGHGPNDLSFLLQRAEAGGADVARDFVIAAYCAALGAAGVKGVNESAITSAVNASERRTRLLYWPDYLGGVSAEVMARHLTRIFST